MKNNFFLIPLVTFFLGLLIGYFIWGQNANNNSGMVNQMNSMSSGLEGKSGDEFDKAFIEEMITHHEGAVVMAQMVLNISKRPELIKLANDIISAQTNEITEMKVWHKSWYGVDVNTASSIHGTGH